MAGHNSITLVGRLGRDPEARSVQSGGKVVNFSMATSDDWTDKSSGERKSRVQWHKVTIWNEKIGEIAERYLKKGSQCLIVGAMEYRKYTDKEGAEREAAEIVLRPFRGELTLLDPKPSSDGERTERQEPARAAAKPANRTNASPSWDAPKGGGDLDDDIPF